MTNSSIGTSQLSRRTLLAATLAAGATLAACGRPRTPQPSGLGEAIAAAEAARPHTGRTVTAALTPGSADVDLGGTIARTLAYNNTIPGPLIRANLGDELAVTVTNGLNHATSVHWHGIALRNDMDGAAPATPNIEAGKQFTYRFSVPNPGTYWAHPHTGLDADYGLYLPVIVDDPSQPGRYDTEWIVVLDDWTDGVGSSPPQLYDGLRRSSTATSPASDMNGMPQMGDDSVPGVGGVGQSDLLAGDAGDISYPYYLINGRVPAAATTFNAKQGQRVRLRIINAGSDTAFRVALAGHRMTVTHTDGYPIVPRDVDAVFWAWANATTSLSLPATACSRSSHWQKARMLWHARCWSPALGPHLSRISGRMSSLGLLAWSEISPRRRTRCWDRPKPMPPWPPRCRGRWRNTTG